MGYVDKHLTVGEQVLYRAKLHWAIFVAPAVAVILGILFMSRGGFATLFGFLVLLVALFRTITAALTYTTTEFVLTNKRIIGKTGLLRQQSLELLLPKVESVGVDQPFLGRIFGYGTIVIGGTGGTKEAFPGIAEPIQLRQMVHSQIG